MKCVAMKRCQARLDHGPHKGRAAFFIEGDVEEFDKCPKNFRVLGTVAKVKDRAVLHGEESIEIVDGIDFKNASEAEINEAEFKLGEVDAALKALSKAEEVEPHIADYSYAKATIYYELRQFDQARHALERTLEINPNHQQALQRQLL